ncbi:MAG: GNAT family N-acetyltransferase [Sphingobacteriia bacterium]|nr:GNAT family N-acetyltransferase [Sphingobacteriia bacterium]
MIYLETPRLILREWKEQDIEAFVKINQDPKVIKFLRGALTLEEAKAFIIGANMGILDNGFGLWAAELKETKELIGFIGLNIPEFKAHFTPCVEIGWRLSSKHWRKGLATEGAKRVLEFAFKDLGIEEIVAFTARNNLASRKVMEKLGMTHDPKENFNHPKLPESHPLSLQVLYRINFKNYKTLEI